MCRKSNAVHLITAQMIGESFSICRHCKEYSPDRLRCFSLDREGSTCRNSSATSEQSALSRSRPGQPATRADKLLIEPLPVPARVSTSSRRAGHRSGGWRGIGATPQVVSDSRSRPAGSSATHSADRMVSRTPSTRRPGSRRSSGSSQPDSQPWPGSCSADSRGQRSQSRSTDGVSSRKFDRSTSSRCRQCSAARGKNTELIDTGWNHASHATHMDRCRVAGTLS